MKDLRLTVRAGLTAGCLALIGAAFGCQFIVTADPPVFACQDGVAGACPAGQFCSGGTCVAGSPNDTSPPPPPPPPEDAETPDVFVPPTDAAPDRRDGATGPAALGGACRIDKDCANGLLCGTEGLLGQAAPAGPVCTRTCCTSEQCGAGFVCLAPGTGGSYCVAAAALGDRTLPATGGAPGGSTCAANTGCRSGLCADLGGSGGKRCIDNCCVDSDCAGGACTVRTLGGKFTGFVCSNPQGTRDAGSGSGNSCAADGTCRSNYCILLGVNSCAARCCNSGQCGSGNSCIWNFAGPTKTDIIQHCLSTGTRRAAREPCVDESDCASTQCELESNGQPDGSTTQRVCRDVCCQDSDCPANERCTPAPNNPPTNPRVLRCVPR